MYRLEFLYIVLISYTDRRKVVYIENVIIFIVTLRNPKLHKFKNW
jgi:hypothetical protein